MRMDAKGDVRYVIVNVVQKGQSVEKGTTGLFMGLEPLKGPNDESVGKGDKFIWIFKDEEIVIFNATLFDIDKIYIGKAREDKKEGLDEYSTQSTNQENHYELLSDIIETMTKQKRILSKGLINTSTYDSIPASLEAKINKFADLSQSTIPTTPRSGIASSTNHHSAACGYSGAYSGHRFGHHNQPAGSYVKKEITTQLIKRTSKYPIGKAIEEMRAKIEEIRKGTYNPPELSKIPADKIEETQNDDDDETHYPFGVG